MKNQKIFNLLFACLLLLASNAHALVLEDLTKNNQLQSMLQNKKVGYYIGSFDPIHKGHEEVAKTVLSKELCDYVIIYPSWGGDSYKQRASVELRLDMLFALFKDHPRIIVTRYPPQELQSALTKVISKEIVAPKFKGLEFIGIIGSDTALKLNPNQPSSIAFMSGDIISAKHENHTWGGCIALPVSSFIVSMRDGDDITGLNKMTGGKPIINVLKLKKHDNISSTLIKKLLKNGSDISNWVSKPVVDIITNNKIYQ